MNADPLPVELLIPADKRRVTIEEHADFRETIAPKPKHDPIDELLSEIREAEAIRKEYKS